MNDEKEEMVDVETLLLDGIEYMVIDKVEYKNNKYIYASQINDPSAVTLLYDLDDEVVGVGDEDTIKKVLSLIIEKNK